ncbi:MAG: hypothetical protein RSF68_01340 [Myroides sp.]
MEEKLKYYEGVNKSRLFILLVLFLLSSFIGILYSNVIFDNSNTYNVTFNVFTLALIQFLILYLFEMKTPTHSLKLVRNYFQNPREILKEKKIVLEDTTEPLPITPTLPSSPLGVSFKDSINLLNGDIIKQVDRRAFELTVEKSLPIFQDQTSIDNLYKLCNGIEIKQKSICIKIDNKRNSKQSIVEILAAIFNIQNNWNSAIKERTNTKIVEFLNTYVLINSGEKTLHSNDFTRLFEKLD